MFTPKKKKNSMTALPQRMLCLSPLPPLSFSCLILILAAASACSDDPSGNNQGVVTPTNATSSSTMTMGTSTSDTSSTRDTSGGGSTVTTCVSKVACDSSVCGMVADGCGGMLDCGTCACENGVPSSKSCGSCGLGTPTCDGEAFSCEFGTEIVAEFDKAMKCDVIAYVDPTAPSGGDGKAQSPWNTYKDALDALSTISSADGLILLASRGVFEEVIELKSGIHVVGGYRPEASGWQEDKESDGKVKKSVIAPSAPATPQDLFGLIAHDITKSTVVGHLRIQVQNAQDGKNVYGAHLLRANQLTFDRLEILAGRGGDGINGANGKDGVRGPDGLKPVCFGGVPVGFPTNNKDCLMASGGNGGQGAKYDFIVADPNASDNFTPAEDGYTSRDKVAKGGRGGVDDSPNFYDGGNGENGRAGIGVSGGRGALNRTMVVDGFWVVQNSAEAGQPGNHGSGGGGGGGAGFINTSVAATDFSRILSTYAAPGSSGGSGGCGGEAGGAGQDGGASFGIFAVESTLRLEASTVTSDLGGKGGQGGKGGSGGRGGNGALGTRETCGMGPTQKALGGAGGDGADGTDGGGGGGGAGGASYGAYCTESSFVAMESSFQAGASAFGGPGGSGGTGGEAGEGGAFVKQFNCY